MEDSYVLQLLKPKFKDFYLCFCGFAECELLHSYGPATRANYILHYVMKGKGNLSSRRNEISFERRAGFSDRAGESDLLSGR